MSADFFVALPNRLPYYEGLQVRSTIPRNEGQEEIGMKATHRTFPIAARSRLRFIAVISLSLLPGTLSIVSAENPVHFADAHLKAAVETHLGVTDPTPTEMLALTTLIASDRGIIDPNGLQYATNLHILWLYHNQISDLSALSGLTNLQTLWLYDNYISDLTALSGLTNLQTLRLSTNQISNLTPLAGLTNLQTLYLDTNQISDLTPLAGLTNLQWLDLSGNQISDLTALAGLTSLQTLWLPYNQISDLTPLAGLTGLQELWLHNNQISDLAGLAGLTSLQQLNLSGNPLNTAAYCEYIPTIQTNNPGISLTYSPNPNPLTQDCSISLVELIVFAEHWTQNGCGATNTWCAGADMIHTGYVGTENFVELSHYWMAPPGP